MLLAFLALASVQMAESRPATAAQLPAIATVRIVRAVEIRGERLEATEESVKRTTVVRDTDGTLRPATLIEFY